MEKFKMILRIVIFGIIGIFIAQLLGMIFVPKWTSKGDPATPGVKGYYLEEPDTIDVLLLGNSDIRRGISPIEMWKEYGITSYNRGTSNQTMGLSYYILKESIEYQKINTVVLDMDALFVTKNVPEGQSRKLLDNMKLNKSKLEILLDKDLKVKNKLTYIFPIFRFHSRWKELKPDDFKILKKYDKSTSYKGFPITTEVKPYIDEKKYMEDKGVVADIPEKNAYYFAKIVNFCKENNIQLLLIEIPSASSWSLARSKATQELAQKYQLEFVDMNCTLKEINFNWETDTTDKGNHLNLSGAEKISHYIGNILKERYNLEDHRKDNKYMHWNEETVRYEKVKKSTKNTSKQ